MTASSPHPPHSASPHAITAPAIGETGRILEGVVTTLDADGSPHIAPMGPIVDERLERLWLRPYNSSITYQNLKRVGAGVFHVTDDVELLARAAVGELVTMPQLIPAAAVPGMILADACRWYAFKVESLDDSTQRTNIVGRVVDRGILREFIGFNRAKHAVVEAAILATRVHLLPPQEVATEFARLATPVQKTGAAAERRAFDFLQGYVLAAMSDAHQ